MYKKKLGGVSMATPILSTERLLLRPFTIADVQAVYECWQSDPDVARYMMWESSEDIAKARRFVNFELTKIDNNEWYRWCITDKESGNVLGTCLIYYNEEENCFDISYNLGKKYWGYGYITEAMKKALEYTSNELGIKKYVAAHAIENEASGHVIEKLGFQFEKEIPYICNGGKIHTVGKFYRLILE